MRAPKKAAMQAGAEDDAWESQIVASNSRFPLARIGGGFKRGGSEGARPGKRGRVALGLDNASRRLMCNETFLHAPDCDREESGGSDWVGRVSPFCRLGRVSVL